MPLYLGLRVGSQFLDAVLIEAGGRQRRILFQGAAACNGEQSLSDAIDHTLGAIAVHAEFDVDDLRAISGAGDPADIASSAALLTDTATDEPVLSEHWQGRFSLPPARIVEWVDDRSARALGIGVIRPGMLGISLDLADAIFTSGPESRGATFRNGALARDWMRLDYGLDGNAFVRLLEAKPGNDGYLMLPWVEAEDTPRVERPGVRRFGFDRTDAGTNVRGLVEGQMMAMANHAANIDGGGIDRIIAIGPGAADHALLQVMANVFGADVHRMDVTNAEALGAALHAFHAERIADDEALSWATVVSGFTDRNPAYRVSPNPRLVAMYRSLRREYAILERLHKDRGPIC
ncbi:MAG TPA: FGGY-family carbohydrate kinase [Vicinamibacterales bacterium]|nr:FGGY-family carbohydrate kinase [Vicinamibacterales bacterium]